MKCSGHSPGCWVLMGKHNHLAVTVKKAEPWRRICVMDVRWVGGAPRVGGFDTNVVVANYIVGERGEQ